MTVLNVDTDISVFSLTFIIFNIMKPVRTANYERADRTAPGHVQRICYTATVTA